MKKIGIVADDITGSQDIGIMYKKKGLITDIYHGEFDTIQNDCDVLIINTDSRFDSQEVAYRKVKDAVYKLKRAGCTQFLNKTCSVLRGNIGAEFDAMSDALNTTFAVVVEAFPENGRTTIGGIQYLNETPIHETFFKDDPLNPVIISNISDIIHLQSKGKVKCLTLEDVRKGANFISDKLDMWRKEYNYVVVDAQTQEDLAIIANAIKDEKYIACSSGIAQELAMYVHSTQNNHHTINNQNKESGILILSGSVTSKTRIQIDAYEKESINDSIKINPLDCLYEKRLIEEAKYQEIIKSLKKGGSYLIYFKNETSDIQTYQEKAIKLGLSIEEASQKLSKSLAKLANAIIKDSKVTNIVVAGGDTSAQVLNEMDIHVVQLLDEIDIGVCSSFALKRSEIVFILKSGSFGNDNFFKTCIQYFKRE